MKLSKSAYRTLFVFVLLVLTTACNDTGGGSEAKDSPGSQWLLFVGTYTKPEPHVDGKGEGIYQLTMDQKSGQLQVVGLTRDAINPSFLAISPDRKFLYAVNEVGSDVAPEGWLGAFSIDPKVPRPVLLGQQSSGGPSPCYLTVDKTGQWLLVANYGGSIAIMRILDNGALDTYHLDLQLEGKGPHPDQQSSHPHMICLSPDNRFVYVPDKGADRIHIFSFDSKEGILHPTPEGFAPVKPGAGPRHMVFHPNGRFVYLINELNATVDAFRWNATTGMLESLQTIGTLPEGFGGNNACADIHVSPDGRFLYGSNRGHNSIVIYEIDQEQGSLSLVGHEDTKGDFPRNFMVTPNGEFLLVANQNSNNIVIFRRNAKTGELTYANQYRSPTPVCLQIW